MSETVQAVLAALHTPRQDYYQFFRQAGCPAWVWLRHHGPSGSASDRNIPKIVDAYEDLPFS